MLGNVKAVGAYGDCRALWS